VIERHVEVADKCEIEGKLGVGACRILADSNLLEVRRLRGHVAQDDTGEVSRNGGANAI